MRAMPERLHKQRVGAKIPNTPSDSADETVASGDAQGDLWDKGGGTKGCDVEYITASRGDKV